MTTAALSHTLASSSTASVPVPGAQEALRTLIGAVRRLAVAQDVEDVQAVACSAARRLTGADGATLVVLDDGQCLYAGDDAIAPLWLGERRPLRSCIGGWAILHRKAAAIADVYEDPRIQHDPYRPTFVRSLVAVPIRTLDPLGAIEISWAARHVATEQEVGLLCALADSTALALQHALAAERARFAAGPPVAAERARFAAGAPLAAERARFAAGAPLAAERARFAAGALLAAGLGSPEPPEADALTGLPNRRTWDRALAETLRPANQPVCVALLDLDRFKAFNERHGRVAGDDLVRRCALAWRSQLRPHDLLGRYGCEQFAVVVTRCDPRAARAVAQRLRGAAIDGVTVSIGIARWDGEEPAESLVCRADEALFRAKREGRDRVASGDC